MSHDRHAEPREQFSPVVRALGPDAIAIADAAGAARQEADRISFSELGRRRSELARALPEGADLAAALAEDVTYKALLDRRDALRRRQAELDRLAQPASEPAANTTDRPEAAVPRTRPREQESAAAARRRQSASNWARRGLHVAAVLAATVGFAVFVQQTQVDAAWRQIDPPAPRPDHYRYTGVWLHPALFEALEHESSTHILCNARRLREFLAERGLSSPGHPPLVRLNVASSFDDPVLQASFGLNCSYTPGPEDVAAVLSALCATSGRQVGLVDLREVPRHAMDAARLPEPMDADALIEHDARRQELGTFRPNRRFAPTPVRNSGENAGPAGGKSA